MAESISIVPEWDSPGATMPATRNRLERLAFMAIERVDDPKFDIRAEDPTPFGDICRGEDYNNGINMRITLRAGLHTERPDVCLEIDEYYPKDSMYDKQFVRQTLCKLEGKRKIFGVGPYTCYLMQEWYSQFDGLKLKPIFDGVWPDLTQIDANGFDTPHRSRQITELKTMWQDSALLTRKRCADITRMVGAFDPVKAHVGSKVK